MKTEKITMAILREIPIGETREYSLPSANAVNTGQSLAYRAQYVLRCKFSLSSDYVNNTISITKSPCLDTGRINR